MAARRVAPDAIGIVPRRGAEERLPRPAAEHPGTRHVAERNLPIDIPPGIKIPISLKSWTPESPNLYGLVLETAQNGLGVDRRYERFGWRQLTFDGNRQLLNGQPLELRGDSWHFLGIPQMTRRYAWSWFRMLKDANGNAVRPPALTK
jgi:beta-galactosidase